MMSLSTSAANMSDRAIAKMENLYDLTGNRIKIAQHKRHTMFCPKCRKPLAEGYRRDVRVEFCESCQGLWVDPAQEKKLLNITPQVLSVDELKRLRRLYRPSEWLNTSGYVPCPVCRELMWRKNWGSYSGVMVDKCAEHGTWFDKGKIEKVKEYVALGGVEYEKMKLSQGGATIILFSSSFNLPNGKKYR